MYYALNNNLIMWVPTVWHISLFGNIYFALSFLSKKLCKCLQYTAHGYNLFVFDYCKTLQQVVHRGQSRRSVSGGRVTKSGKIVSLAL